MTIRELITLRIEKTKKRIAILKQRIESLEEKHKGNELKDFTYWAGFDMGYLKASISSLENQLDILNELNEE
ncbi:hypothetical protein PG299_10090 [Riemerella anatipestifer]|nr:hypothetical protein [Riemerella anatipestifer]